MSSFNKILNKLLLSIKDELKNKDNINIITHDIINPIVDKILENIYPYLIEQFLYVENIGYFIVEV